MTDDVQAHRDALAAAKLALATKDKALLEQAREKLAAIVAVVPDLNAIAETLEPGNAQDVLRGLTTSIASATSVVDHFAEVARRTILTEGK